MVGERASEFDQEWEVTVVEDKYHLENVVYASYEVWHDRPAVPRQRRSPAWMEDPAAVAAIVYAFRVKNGHVIQDRSREEQDIEVFRRVLPGALAYYGKALERVPGGWRVCGTI